MYRAALCAMIPALLASSAILHAESSWPQPYCFFGRWDCRTAHRAVTVSSGSYVLARFSGESLKATFDLSTNNPHCNNSKDPSYPTIAWRIDNGEWSEAQISHTVELATGLPTGIHNVMLMVRGMDENQNRWTDPLVASVTFTGFITASNGKLEAPLASWRKPKLTMEFLGDSITEGVLVGEGRAGTNGIPLAWPWLSDALRSYSCQTAMKLGAQWRQVGFGATGLEHGGSGGALGAIHTFNWFYAGCPRDKWQPNVVVINHGTNDGGMDSQDYQKLYMQYLQIIRTAYPKAKIVALRPFGGYQEAAIKACVQACNAAGDKHIYYIDTTGWYDGPVHPNAASSVGISDKLAAELKQQVLSVK